MPKIEYKHKSRFAITFIVLVVVLIILSLTSLSIGHFSYNPFDVLQSIGDFFFANSNSNQAMDNVLLNIRLPRLIAALIIGSALSLSGSVYQGVFRNPLVSPDILGVSSGACVGAAIAILFGMGAIVQQLFAFALGMGAVCIALIIPKVIKNNSNIILVLSGIITAGFFSSLMALLKFTASQDSQLAEIVFWQMGSLARIGYQDLLFVVPIVVVCTIVLLLLSWRINILSFGEVEAKTLGINTTRLRGIIVVCASLLTASTVCISGTIG